jgi:microcystin degradation protein MlrC
MAVIAIATFQHETNTFAPTKASFAHFQAGGGWPGYTVGDEINEIIQGKNIPIAGFASAIRQHGHQLHPLVFANATPSAQVTSDAFERVMAGLIGELQRVGKVDAIYLDLHGAMVTEAHDDGEGEILARLRKAGVGDIPIVASLDLHANVSDAMVELSDGLVAYRTYPHIDMTETGARAAALLSEILQKQRRPEHHFRRLDFLIPLTSQCTLTDPGDRLYGMLAKKEAGANAVLSFAPGFPAADIADCGPTVFGYGFDRAALVRAVDEMASAVQGAEGRFQNEFLSPNEAIKRAVKIGVTSRRPVILADTQDNPGAGGNGDTTGLLAAMIDNKVASGLVGLLIDPAAAALAHEVGRGGEREFSLGAKSGLPGHFPVRGKFSVYRVSDGEFTCSGPFYKGADMKLGPMAALRREGVTVVVASKKVQAADQDMFRHMGVDPLSYKIVALKSSVHFRAHFQPIAEEILVVAAPGPMAVDPAALPWTKLRDGVRLGPGGKPYAKKPA